MAAHLYRRHRRDCKAGHAEDSTSGEFQERKKAWKRCDCPIFATASINKKRFRKSTGQWEWDGARTVASGWEQAANWDGPNVEPPQPEKRPDRTKITEATDAFVARAANRNLQKSTIRKYLTLTRQLNAYAADRGYVMLDQLTVADMDRFYAAWRDGIRSKAKKLETLKSFLRFCRKRKWMEEDIAEDLQAPEGSSIAANKNPFTDDELKRIYAACDAIGGPKPPGPGYRPWGGEDVKDFVMLSVYTGLRISDVATFDITKRLNGNDVFLRMHKTRRELFTWIPDWLVERLREREKKHGALIFRAGTAMNIRSASERWRENLGKVFELAGPWETKATPHRMRHTFVRILLEKGVPDTDVAELIGDTVEVLRKHYARWMPTRQARLSKILKEAFDETPKLKVVNIR